MSMSLKNNLDHVLRHPKPTNSASTSQLKSASKFKPANASSVSANPLRKQASTTLPSFSTPGFRKPRASGSDFCETINISSDSSSMSPGIKRTSSDSQLSSDSQPSSKRPRSEKENVFHPVPSKDKGKSKVSVEPTTRDIGPGNRANIRAPTSPTEFPDLTSKSSEELHDMLLANHEYNRQNMQAICDYHSGSAPKEDIFILETFKSILNGRIGAIKDVLKNRESGTRATVLISPPHLNAHQPPSPSRAPNNVPMSPLSIAASTSVIYESTSYASTSSAVRVTQMLTHDRSFKSGPIENSVSEPDILEEENDLWAGVDDVTMEDLDDTPVVEEPAQELTGPYAKEVMLALTRDFKLKRFRTSQFEAIDAALSGRDVFVLVPTGGGKSLCYQLPAVCRGGKTKGVSIVVSPLLALMHDQVNGLKEKGIDAVLLTSETQDAEIRHIRDRLYSQVKPQLLYVTPERLKISSNLKSTLNHLYRNKELARFVIDEAHCISTWGQDFRDAYQDLGALRNEFPDVPIMALTATANPKTVDDILARLQLRNPAIFRQSFNRKNLFYRIVPKGSMDEMVNFIKESHPTDTGIIYRTGRDSCEKMAQQLRQKNLQARHYHAQMEPDEKSAVLEEWKKGKCRIIVATIAFGMGIDQANVRFVIHWEVPKNIDGYYQETGRAGRDGEAANCVLYYSHRDVETVRKMIRDNKDGKRSQEIIERQEEALQAVVSYCKNNTTCRRTQIMQYFGETFNEKDCGGLCDSCTDKGLRLVQDVTEEAKSLLSLVKSMEDGRENVTLEHCRRILKGSNAATVREKGHDKHPAFGAGRDLPKELFDLLFHECLAVDAMVEKSMQTNNKWHHQYLKLGPNAHDYLSGKRRLQIGYKPYTPKPGGKPKAAKRPRKAAAPAPELPEPQRSLYEDDSTDDIEFSPKKNECRQPAAPIEIISDSEDGEPRIAPPRATSPQTLYQKLLAHRQKILDDDPSLTKDDVLDDEMLQYMSAAPPHDFAAFQRIIQDIRQENFGATFQEAKKDAQDRFTKFGAGFLEMCVGRSGDPSLREMFAYKPPAHSTPRARGPQDLKKFKFKPSIPKDA